MEVALLVEAGKGVLSTDSILLEPTALLVRSGGRWVDGKWFRSPRSMDLHRQTG